MSAYEIMISAEQRLFILTALKQCQFQGYFGADREGRKEIDLLTACFETLPDPESADNFHVDSVTGKRRHVLHGFCL